MEPSIESREWDAIIVGTGMGGGTIGYKLAQAGLKVLFLEKGKSHLGSTTSLTGQFAELFFPVVGPAEPKYADILAKAGRWTTPVLDESGEGTYSSIPFVGSGTGGSSALYGMAMERFTEADFNCGAAHSGEDDSNLPDAWPMSYADFKPYYEQAESLYRVRGTTDPLRREAIETYQSPIPLVAPNQELFQFLDKKGLHPYNLPLACDAVEGCQNCQGYICPKNCRNDSAKICVDPAIKNYGATLLDSCEVIRIETGNSLVNAVVCNWQGRTIKLRGKNMVLAAGALQTPALLLRSATTEFPGGLANSSGQVGRNLMRHYIDIYAIAVSKKPRSTDNLKQIAFNDLLFVDGNRYGTVQSFGPMPPASIALAKVRKLLSRVPLLSQLLGIVEPIAEFGYSFVFGKKLVMASIMEDLPYADNKVSLSASGEVVLNYTIPPAEKVRIETFRKKIGAALKPYFFIRIKQAESNARIAHVCGTVRSGSDPKTSVLDSFNRAHDIKNLFVADSSFFPSSGGTNPALTIAASALRTADHIIATSGDR